MAVFEKTFVQDLTQNLTTHHCEAIVFSADNESNVVNCALYQGAEPAVVTGNVVVYAIRADGNTVTFAGTLGNNVASATLPQSCCVAPGPLAVMLQIVSGDVKTTVLKAIFTVEASSTGAIIDPGHVIPDIADIIAMLDDLEEAIADAEAATDYIAPTETSPAESAHSVGEYIIYNGGVYEVTAAIAVGDTLTVGTNIRVVPNGIYGVVTDLNAEIGDLITSVDSLSNSIEDTEELVDNTAWVSNNNNAVTNNNDGTFTFGTSDYGTTIFATTGIVPPGDYVLGGIPYGFTEICTLADYQNGVVYKNETGSNATYHNPVGRKLYLIVRLNSKPSTAFTFAPSVKMTNNRIDGVQSDMADLRNDLKVPLIYTSNEYATLTNSDNLKLIAAGGGATFVSQTNDVRTFTFGDGNEPNPNLRHLAMNLGTKKWMVGLKYRITKLDQSASSPQTMRVYLGNTLYYTCPVTLGEWHSFCETVTVDFSELYISVRGFSPAPTSGQIQFEVKEYFVYDVSGLSDALISKIADQQDTEYSDGIVYYETGDSFATDPSLTGAGKAADAKAVGDAITALGGIPSYQSIPFSVNKAINNSGVEENDSNIASTDYIALDGVVAISYAGRMGSYRAAHWYDSNKTWLSCNMYLNDKTAYYVNAMAHKPTGAAYLRLQSKKSTATLPPAVPPEVTVFNSQSYIDLITRQIVGDGTTDDTNAVQRCVNMAESVVFPRRDTILLSSPVYVTLGYSRIIDGNGCGLLVNDDFYALSIAGTLSTSSDATNMDANVVKNEAATIIKNFRITSNDTTEGGGIEATKAFKLKICDNYIHHMKNGIRLYGQCRDVIISNNNVFAHIESGILFDEGINIHQCNINNNMLQYAHDVIHIYNPSGIANFQIVSNDIEIDRFPESTYATATCIHFVSSSSTVMLAEIEICGNTIQGHSVSDAICVFDGVSGHKIRNMSISGNHISNAHVNAILLNEVTNVAITGNNYASIGGYVYGMDGECQNVVICGEAATSIVGKIHAASTATLDTIVCKNVVFSGHDLNSIETSNVTNVDIT